MSADVLLGRSPVLIQRRYEIRVSLYPESGRYEASLEMVDGPLPHGSGPTYEEAVRELMRQVRGLA